MIIRALEAVLGAAASSAESGAVTTENMIPALEIMGLGMLGIFFVIGVIILLLKLLTALFPPKEEKKD